MSRKKPVKTEPKPTPPMAIDKSETLAHDDAPIVIPSGPSLGADAAGQSHFAAPSNCPICGTARTADVCPVDGHRFEVKS